MRQNLLRTSLVSLFLVSTVAHAEEATLPNPATIDEAAFQKCAANPETDGCDAIKAACRESKNAKCDAFRASIVARKNAYALAEIQAGGGQPLAGGATKVNGRTLPDSVALALDRCTPANQCNNLSDFRRTASAEYPYLQLWCHSRMSFDYSMPRAFQPKSVKRLCKAVREDRDDALRAISQADILLMLEEANKAFYTCNGFGFTVPLFSVRRGLAEDRDGGGEARARGPIESGVGAGYYWALGCHPEWTWGIQGYGFTEGLDPSGKFQVGLGAGVGLTAFKYFRFGLGVGYDLYRQSAAEDGTLLRNGLLIGKYAGRHSLTWHITFGLQSTESQTSAPEVAPAAGTAGQP